MIALLILIAALVCFLLATFVPPGGPMARLNMAALGLAFLTVYFMLGQKL